MAVRATGRKVRPAAFARSMLMVWEPRIVVDGDDPGNGEEHLVLDQEVVVFDPGPGHVGGGGGPHAVDELLHRHEGGRPSGVEHAMHLVLQEMNVPLGEVSNIDLLDLVGLLPRDQDLSTAGQAIGPIGTTVGRVQRADDIPGTNDQSPVLAEGLLRLELGLRLHDAVPRGPVFTVGLVHQEWFGGLVDVRGEVGVEDARRGDIEIGADVVLEELGLSPSSTSRPCPKRR